MSATEDRPAATASDVMVRIHDGWHGWRTVEVRLRDLEEIHWLQPAGAPHPLLHAYVAAEIIAGSMLDNGRPQGSLRQRVCILKRHATPKMYATLARRADDQLTLVSRTTPPGLTMIGRLVNAISRRNSRA